MLIGFKPISKVVIFRNALTEFMNSIPKVRALVRTLIMQKKKIDAQKGCAMQLKGITLNVELHM